MQGPSWIATLERIPANLHDSLVITLVTGAEIMMQSVLRLESDFCLIRGRMAGSTDAGRVIVLPYDQMVNLAISKRMLAADVQAVFGQTLEPVDGSAAVAANAEEDSAPADEAPPPAAETPKPSSGSSANAKPHSPPATTAPTSKSQAPPSKSILLARLRARLAEQGKA